VKIVAGTIGLTTWALAASLTWAAEAAPPGGGPTGTEANVERFLMEGTEIQGTLEKPHVVYVVPWKDTTSITGGEIPLRRSFSEEILEPVDRARFQRLLSQPHTATKGGGSNE